MTKKKDKDLVSRFSGLLPDIEELTQKIIENDLDPTQALEVSSAVDSQVPWAKNFFEWCSDRRFIGVPPYAKQCEIMMHLFEEFCGHCSDQEWIKSIPVTARPDEIRSHITFLEHGKCPTCGFDKETGRKEGYFKDPTEMIIVAGQRSGKCLSPDTEILANGERRTVGSLVDQEFELVTMTEDHKFKYAPATAFRSGTKPCLKLTIGNGSSMVLTEDHRVYTARGYVEAGKLLPEDLIAAPRKIPEPPKPLDISDEEVVMAAYLLSDGSVAGTATRFTNETTAVVADFTEVGNRLSDPQRDWESRSVLSIEQQQLAVDKKKSGMTYDQVASDMGIARHLVQRVVERERVGYVKTGVLKEKTRLAYSVRGLQWFRDKWGIHGKAVHKRIPKEFWGLSDRQTALFLNRFWACDGYVTGATAGVTLASETMCRDLQYMMLRLGVRAGLTYKKAKCNGKEYDAWRLEAHGQDADKFLQEIGPVLGKEEACKRLHGLVASRKQPKTLTDPVPVNRREVREMAAEIRAKTGAQVTQKMRDFSSAKDRGYMSRGMFERMCDEFGYDGKHSWLRETDIRWQKIRSIEPAGTMDVYDISVPDTECFVAENMVVHNSALVSYLASYIIHRMLGVQHPWKQYGLLPGQILEYTFVAKTVGQSEKTLWGTFKKLLTQSAWFKAYKAAVDKEAKEAGVKGEIVKVLETFIKFEHKNLIITVAASDGGSLRGATRFGAAIDELAYFSSDPKAVKANGPETYAALDNSCLTLRKKHFAEKQKNPKMNWVMPMMLNISSPREMADPIMTAYKAAVGNEKVISRHWPTWEMSPDFTKEVLHEMGETAKPTFQRDYGAIPPIADDPLIGKTNIIIDAFDHPFANDTRYGPVIRPSALGWAGVEHEVVGDRETKSSVGGLQDELERIDYRALLSSFSEEDLEALGNQKNLFVELCERPPHERMHIMGVDLGHTQNSLAVVCGFLADNYTKFVTDFILEIVPPDDAPINIVAVHRDVIEPLVERLNVVSVIYDKWNSLQSIQDLSVKYGSLGPLHDKKSRKQWLSGLEKAHERPAFLADSYSLNMADALTLVGRLQQGDCLFPAMEVPFMELVQSDVHDPTEVPYGNLAKQMATVRARGARLLKPVRGNDDVFRAWTNAVVPAFTNELIRDLLQQEFRGAPKAAKANVGFHVSLGQRSNVRQVRISGGNANSSNFEDFPVTTRKGKY